MSAILKTLVSRVLHLPTRGETLGTRLPQTSLFNPVRVNREEWLGGPANSKGPAYCFGFDVEPHRHVTLTAHTFKTKMADDTEELIFGNDFEAILGALEADEDRESEFAEAADGVIINRQDPQPNTEQLSPGIAKTFILKNIEQSK